MYSFFFKSCVDFGVQCVSFFVLIFSLLIATTLEIWQVELGTMDSEDNWTDNRTFFRLNTDKCTFDIVRL